MKTIYGSELSARRLRGLAGVTTMRDRREALVAKFAWKCANDPALDHWFPKKNTRRSTRRGGDEIYLEERARCERLKNSPLFYFRRILNGKVGKTYGVRNKSYREDIIGQDGD